MFKYVEIAEWLRKQIKEGIYPAGTKLPTEQKLMKQFGVSRQSVRRAILELEDEHLVQSIQGSGTYVGKRSVQAEPAGSDPAGITGASPKSNQIALVLTNYEDYIFPRKISGIYETLEAAGYIITLFFTDNQFMKEVHILRTLLDRNYAGMLLDGTQSAYPRYDDALFRQVFRRIPCIMMDSRYQGYDLPCVTLDDEKGGYLVTRHLISCGHKRIAYIGRGDYRQGIKRGFGYSRAMTEAGLEYRDKDMIWYTLSIYPTLFKQRESSSIIEMLRSYTAVVCYNDQVAFDLISLLEKHGIRVPEDISVTGYDHADIAGCTREITTIEHPKSLLGKQAAENLLRLMRDPTFDANYLFEPRLAQGDTVAILR